MKMKEIRSNKMKLEYPGSEKASARKVFVLSLMCVTLLLISPQRSAAQQHYNSFSSMLEKSSMWRSSFYNDIIRANSGSFGQVGDAPRVSDELIQNLCKPFPCSGPKPSIMGPQPSQPAYPRAPANVASVPARSVPITATDFRPAGGRIMPDEIARLSQSTEDKELLRTLSNQFIDALEREGRKNNMANSFAFLTSISMQIVIGRDLTDAEEQQLISGFNTSLAYSPQFTSMTARDKQVLYETAIIAGGMIAFLHEQGKQHNDAKMQSDARTMAKAVLISLFGIKLD
jgi:hypothetical protein